MTRILALVDETPAAEAAVEQAVAAARESGAELTILGVLRPRLEAPQPAFGERVRRFRAMESALAKAAARAGEANLAIEVDLQLGDPRAKAFAAAEMRMSIAL